MAWWWRRSPGPSRRCAPDCRPDGAEEAGFSLVEVLAALAIASMALVLSMQLLVQSARVDARLTHETAARDLVRRLMAEGAEGRGAVGVLGWAVVVTPVEPGLVRRVVAVSWPAGPGLIVQRLEAWP